MLQNSFSLEGKTVLITGAGGGIGAAVAERCSDFGARVVLTDINEEALNSLVSRLPKDSVIRGIVADLTDQEAINSIVENCPDLDGLVCNAGIMRLILTQFLTEDDIVKMQKVNLIAPMLLTKSLIKSKKIKRGGSIVYTASAGGVFRVSAGNGIYATTKCGIDAFMRTVALELGPKGIRANSVNPGMVETPLIKNGQLSEEFLEKEKLRYPLRRFAQPVDIANGIVFLLSEASSFVTGTALKIDGGLTLA